MKQELQRLKEIEKEIKLLQGIAGLLQWDRETIMPLKGAEQRSEQMSYVEQLLHEHLTGKELKKIIRILKKKDYYQRLQRLDRIMVDKYDKTIKKNEKIPCEHVKKSAKAQGDAYHAWERARKCKKYSLFAPHLKTLVALKKKEAAYIDAKGDAYDVLLDEFEEGMTTKILDPLFDKLKDELTQILEKIKATKTFKDEQKKKRKLKLPIEGQELAVKEILNILDIDKEKMFVGVSLHPFTNKIGLNDIRFTTRYREDDPFESLMAAMHEAGHALYESNIDPKLENTILQDAPSLGMHEAQARFWENHVGRNEAFWSFFYPQYKKYFKKELKGINAKEIYRKVTKVNPTLIALRADEITKSLHVIIRYEIAKELMRGRLRAEDVPVAWKAKCRKYLGMIPKSDSEGIIQDVHWALGYFGYFPTYILGAIYAAMFFEKIKSELPFQEQLKQGKLRKISKWFKDNVHQYGASMTAPEIIMRTCKRELSADDFIKYLKDKYYPLYGVKE